MQQQLTKEQALEILTKATALFKGSREEHQLIQLSLVKLSQLVEKEEPPKE